MKILKYIILFLLLFFNLSFAATIDELYKSLIALDQNSQVGRTSYTAIGDKFYKIYSNNPNGVRADEAVMGAARAYRRAYEKFRMHIDFDRAQSYYRIVQGAYTTVTARKAYLESADLFAAKKDTASAKFVMNKLIAKYPKSKEAAEAKNKIAKLSTPNNASVITKLPDNSSEKKPTFVAESNIAKKKEKDNSTTNPTVNMTDSPGEVVDESNIVVDPKKVVTVHGVRYFSDKNKEYSRIVVDLSGNVNYKSHWLRADKALHKPPRLTIDVENSNLNPQSPKNVKIRDGLLSAVRLGYHAEDKRTRIVLDSENIQDFAIFQMPNPSRLIIDVFSAKRTEGAKRPTIITPMPDNATQVAANDKNKQEQEKDKKSESPKDDKNLKGKDDSKKNDKEPKAKEDKPKDNKAEVAKKDNEKLSPYKPDGSAGGMTLGAALGLKIKTIVLDPGHGGKDPGASYYNLKEKDIVLEVSKYLYQYLKQDPSLKVYLTRNRDIFIPLEERTAIANKLKADLFISVHVNAAKRKEASGVETFVFNVTNDRGALEVAAFENQATTKSISDLQGILKDILKYSKLEESLSLAGSVQQKLAGNLKVTKAQNLGVKQAPFYVLVGATMPAILVEMGFLSNKAEADKLATSQYRKKVAEGIYHGIKEYIDRYNY